jgi:prepilin-type N-terminal cleavage/methylation domain-containing protein
MRRNNGFTMVELVVVVLIMGMAMVAMAPQFAKGWKRSDLELVSSRMETALRLCRQKAVLYRKPYRLTIDTGDKLFYSERRDSTGVWVIDPPDTHKVDRGISFDAVAGGGATNHDIFFETRGTISLGDSPARIRFWNSRGETLSVNVVRTGRVRVTRQG